MEDKEVWAYFLIGIVLAGLMGYLLGYLRAQSIIHYCISGLEYCRDTLVNCTILLKDIYGACCK